MYRFLLLLTCIFSFNLSFGQKPPNIWYFGDHAGLEFQKNGNLIVLDNSAMKAFEGSAVQVDENGSLLFYTNGEEIFNKNHGIMQNGDRLSGHVSAQQSSLIVPAPNSSNIYYVFTTSELKSTAGLNYSIVDMSQNNGLGGVVEKNINLHKPSTEGMSIVGNCSCKNPDTYWLLAFKSNQKDSVYAYKLDKNGIEKNAVRSYYRGIGQVDYVRFSPDGKVVAFLDKNVSSPTTINLVISKFDFQSGKMEGVKIVQVLNGSYYYSTLFFSPDGRLLYTNINHDLKQYNVTDYQRNLPYFSFSITNPPRFGTGQIGLDGRIYLAALGREYLTVIQNPNVWGDKANIEIDAIGLGKESSWGLPHFAEQLSYNGVSAAAGADSLICSGTKVKIGGKELNNSYTYEWFPSTNLSSSSIANPLFSYTNNSTTVKEFTYVLAATDENCSRCDTLKISVLPEVDTLIYGPKSVCPGVEDVKYSVVRKEGYFYKWEVEGGIIVGSNDENEVKVNWGATNDDAKIKLYTTSSCRVDSTILPIRINVVLKSDKPNGNQRVCLNLLENQFYSVPNAPGSIYQWFIVGGKIVSGDGTSNVNVNFDGSSQAKLWLQEYSTTKDTVCFGSSDTVTVDFYKDTTTIRINYASVDPYDETKVIISKNATPLTEVLLSVEGQEFNSQPFSSTIENIISIEDINTSYQTLDIKLKAENNCSQNIESDVHGLILLRAESDNSLIHLNWTAYKGWKTINYYEVWRKVDKEDTFSLISVVDGDQNFLTGITGNTGFKHTFRIKGLNENGNFTFSNSKLIELKHQLFIPNVFTPNNDNINDHFVIKNIELFSENQLTIYNRWGQQVFKKKNYLSDWDGDLLPKGIYYYLLELYPSNQRMKGWVQILH